MTDEVKKPRKRAYSSVVRQEQAAQTRSRILDAAADLFASMGYARTTVRQIADTAQVAPDTVYAVFGTKARILTALIDQRLAPAGDRNVLDRPEAQAIRDERDQRRQLHLFAIDTARLSARVRPVYEILRTAAAVEPDMATVHAEMDRYRLANMQRLAGWVAANGRLRADADTAAPTIWALASPDVAKMLCEGLGWSTERYAAWLEDVLARTLLSDTGAAGQVEPGDSASAPDQPRPGDRR